MAGILLLDKSPRVTRGGSRLAMHHINLHGGSAEGKVRMAEETGPLTATAGIHLFLLRQLDTGTINQLDKVQIHDLCYISSPKIVIGMPGNPLVVELNSERIKNKHFP